MSRVERLNRMVGYKFVALNPNQLEIQSELVRLEGGRIFELNGKFYACFDKLPHSVSDTAAIQVLPFIPEAMNEVMNEVEVSR